MRFLVVGPGAVGCILGASAIRSGHNVTFLARGESLKALKDRGLKVEWPTETWEIRDVHVMDSGSASGSFDHILFCVKGYEREKAASLIRSCSAHSILTFQNGVVVHKELRKQFGEIVRPAVIYVSADRIGPAVVRSKSASRVVLDGTTQGRDEMMAVQEALNNSWLTASLSETIEIDLWRKYLFLCSFSALNTLTEKPLVNLLNDPQVKNLWLRYMLEIAAIARSSKIDLSDDEVQAAMKNAEKFPPNTTSSLFSDTQRKQQTEVELLQGHLSRLAEELGVEAPISHALYALLRQKTST